MPTGEFILKRSYLSINSIHLPTAELREAGFEQGNSVTFLVEGDPEFSHAARLNNNTGLISGMAALYKRYSLQSGDALGYTLRDDGVVILRVPEARLPGEITPPQAPDTVFERQKLLHVHMEQFRPENLRYWEPENEVDVFMVFGVLQDYTEFRYCRGLSQALIAQLRYRYRVGSSKPDAVVVEAATGRYLIAEWKKNSSDFKTNHSREDVDVLVVWNDDEAKRDVLPERVLDLREVARIQAMEALEPETETN